MKNTLQKFAILALLISGFGLSTHAQTVATPGKATISPDFVISIDATSPMVADYTFDISAISFKDQATAEKLFKTYRDNLVSYEVNYAEKTVKVHLMLEYVAPRGWTVDNWNKYFTTVSDRYRSNYSAINK